MSYIKLADKRINIESIDCASYILEFVSINEQWDDYCRSCEFWNYSTLEWVIGCKFYSFRTWMLDKYQIYVVRGSKCLN